MDSSNPAERQGDVTPPANHVQGSRGPAPRDDASLGVWLASNALTIILTVTVILWLSWKFGPSQVANAALAAVALGFVVFVHELGHFFVAKWCDVHVEVFSIGFGPALPGCSFQWGETFYKLALFPLGGYVKMVGEGTESEEDDHDPRSFKNKTVGQRMAIISAGVVLNVVLAAICFVIVYMGHGIERPAAIIGGVDARSPAWQKGVPSGSVIHQIGSVRDPFFDDVMPEVTNSTEGQQIPLVYETPDEPGKLHRTLIEPRKEKSDPRPLIGITMIDQPRLIPKKGSRASLPPVWLGSAAANAEPPFEFGDVIIGMTDPNKPDQVTLLPPDPRHPDDPRQADVLEMRRRLDLLAGKEITLLVRRDKKDAGPDESPVAIKVPPSYHYTLGLRMRMGQVTSIRENSPAAQAGVQARNVQTGDASGDIIKEVEVTNADGTKTRWVSARSKDVPAGIVEKDLDPMRLPSELQQWANSKPTDRKVRLKVLRQVGHAERQEVNLALDWDDRWKHDRATPLTRNSPLPINELGLAYRVETMVDAVQPDSPAAKAGLQKGDFIKAIRFYRLGGDSKEAPTPDTWNDIQGDQWAQPASLLADNYDVKKVDLRVERDGGPFETEITAVPDPTWPLSDRGLILTNELRLHKADSPKEALAIGFHRTTSTIKQIYLQLRSLLTGRVSVEMLGGPIQIAKTSYLFATAGYWDLLYFMALISVNLAVINFLPIPVLDGGHMVFLIYEKLRGRPASEQVRAIVTYAGLMLIVSLMVFVTYLDVKRW